MDNCHLCAKTISLYLFGNKLFSTGKALLIRRMSFTSWNGCSRSPTGKGIMGIASKQHHVR